MGKPTAESKVSKDTAEKGFDVGDKLLEVLSPLTYQGRGGGNPDAPENVGLLGADGDREYFDPPDPLGLLPEDSKGRGKRGGAY